MKIVDYISAIKPKLLKIRHSRMQSRKNYAVSEILGSVLILMIVTGAISTILFWGIPYMEDKKASIALENTLLQFDAMGDLIDDAFGEGVFDVDSGEMANSSKTMNFQLSSGTMYLEPQGERFVFWYSLVDNFYFNVSNLDPDGNEYSFSIESEEGGAKFVDLYYLYDNSLSELDKPIPGEGIITTRYPLQDTVQIDVEDASYNDIGRIWLFDVGSLTYKSVSSLGTYRAIVENGGVLSTGVKASWHFFNEPKYWPQLLLDNSSMLTMRIIQIKKDPSEGVDSIGGTGSSKVKFCIRPDSSETMESKIQIFKDFKMNIYGYSNAVSAWRFFYKYRMGFQGDDIDEPLLWVPPMGASNVMFSLNHAVCFISMEV